MLWYKLIKLLELDLFKYIILILLAFKTFLGSFKMVYGNKVSSLNMLNSYHARKNNGFLSKENIQELLNSY